MSIRDSDMPLIEQARRGEVRAAATRNQSPGVRLGLVWNYAYGESRPELRPTIDEE